MGRAKRGEAAGGSVRPGGRLTAAQRRYLERGISQPGGKLALFDANGREIDPRTIRSCIERGWAKPWFSNPLKPAWLVCKLTEEGREAVKKGASAPA